MQDFNAFKIAGGFLEGSLSLAQVQAQFLLVELNQHPAMLHSVPLLYCERLNQPGGAGQDRDLSLGFESGVGFHIGVHIGASDFLGLDGDSRCGAPARAPASAPAAATTGLLGFFTFAAAEGGGEKQQDGRADHSGHRIAGSSDAYAGGLDAPSAPRIGGFDTVVTAEASEVA